MLMKNKLIKLKYESKGKRKSDKYLDFSVNGKKVFERKVDNDINHLKPGKNSRSSPKS